MTAGWRFKPGPAPQDGAETQTRTEIYKQQRRAREEQERIARLRADVKAAEEAIARLERQSAELEKTLLQPEVYGDHVAARQAAADISDIKRRIEQAYAAWEDAEQALAEAQKYAD